MENKDNMNAAEESEVKAVTTKREKILKKKKRKKKIIIFSIIGGVLLILVIVIILVAKAFSAASKMMSGSVFTVDVKEDVFESDVEVSGIVESDKILHYNAPGVVEIDSIAKAGSFVKKGEKIVVFNQASFDEALRIAELENTMTLNAVKSSEIQAEEALGDYNTAKANYSKYSALVNSQQAEVDKLTSEITDANAIKSAELRSKIYECQKQLNDFTYLAGEGGVINGLSEDAMKTYAKYAKDKSYEIGELQHQLEEISGSVTAYEQSKILADAQTKLADYKAEQAKAESEKEAYGKALGNEYDRENVTLKNELDTIQADKSYSSFLDYTDGLVAPFDGVVIAVSYTDGDTTAPSSPLLTFASVDDITLSFSITKNELTKVKEGQKATVTLLGNKYDAEVIQINRMVSQDMGGSTSIGGIMKILNPDDSICIGLEGKAKIETARIDKCISIPLSAINVDDDGDFVYVYKDGVIQKRYVETAETSNSAIVVTEGLSVGDSIVSSYMGEISDGMAVTAVPEGMMN